jgi:hypothetical protein
MNQILFGKPLSLFVGTKDKNVERAKPHSISNHE